MYTPDPVRPLDAQLVLRRLHRNRVLGLVTCLLVWVFAVAAVTLLPEKYSSTAILLVDTARLQETATRYASSEEVVSVFGMPTVANQAAMLKTVPAIAESTAETLLARGTDLAFLPTQDPAKLAEWIREAAVEIVPESGEDRADLISITGNAGSPTLAAAIAELYGQAYISMMQEAVATQREKALEAQRTRVTDAGDVLAGLDEQLRQFWQENGTVTIEQDAQQAARRITDLQASLDEARIELSTQSATLTGLEREYQDLDLDQLANRVASPIEAEITSVHGAIAAAQLALDKFYSNYPYLRERPEESDEVVKLLNDLKVMNARVDELSDDFVAEIMDTGGIDLARDSQGRAYILSLRRGIAEARIAKAAAQAKVNTIRSRLTAITDAQMRYSEQAVPLTQIQRGREQADTRLKTEITRLGELEAAEPADHVKRMQAAMVPEKPSFPNIPLMLGGGFILGLLLGAGAAYGRSAMDHRVYDEEDVASFGVPVRGAIPDLSQAARQLVGRSDHVDVGSRVVSSKLVVLHGPHTVEAALTRKYALGLAARTPRGGMVLVTSADTGAGKTTVTANLAAALSLAGYRTLLIDADIFRAGQMDTIGLTPRSSLNIETGAFNHGGGIEQFGGALQLLFGIKLASRIPSDAEAHAVRAAGHLGQFYGQYFDFVLLDTPPTAVSSIAAGLSRHAHRQLVVVGAGHTHRELVGMAVADLQAEGSAAAEIVLNRVDMEAPAAFRSAYKQAQAYYGSTAGP